ncbi:unnamed protein product [Victoria cruziana]
MKLKFLCTIFFVVLANSACTKFSKAAPEKSLITRVPGFDGTLPSKHYGGYIKLDEATGKSLYYYFVMSESNPSKDPVVLWLNGGPGCSSFDGFVYEHGPFNFRMPKSEQSLPELELNPYSWSKVSNVIYLDSPAGVGLSYSNNSSDYTTGDAKTASDTHQFLLKWFAEYPEFQKNPFLISGESYAGVYVPTLSHEVVNGIESGVKPVINFKGYLIGNGVTDPVFDGNALVPFAHGMGLIPDTLFEEAKNYCKGTYWDTLNSDADCSTALNKIDEDIDSLNIYDILEPCYHKPHAATGSHQTKLPPSFRQLGETEKPLAVRKRMFGRSWPLRAPVREGLVPTWSELNQMLVSVPCTDDHVATAWLNDETVRNAIHAAPIGVSGQWDLCTDRIRFYHNAGSMIPYHRNLTTRGYRALIYSGDHDMCVPFTGTEAWTRSLGYKIVDEWRTWIVDANVAGYTQGYSNNLTFLTVKVSILSR